MGGIRELSCGEHRQLEQWLESEGIVLNGRTRRDIYSDVRAVAEILKKVCPCIKLEFYPAVSSFSRRLQNWQVFAFRVLQKLGLRLTPSDLRQLAAGRAGAIEWLLFSVFAQEQVPPSMWSLSKAVGPWAA
ncbi:sperm flagellar protein 1-like [Drosophila madeirensis]|uniref:Sperm flagellar protein 1-like n=1 Tax=Drosophila madeirensis TaxID=30013 RepID=A0AAU9G045_DROMD